jgi:hypothetical protein
MASAPPASAPATRPFSILLLDRAAAEKIMKPAAPAPPAVVPSLPEAHVVSGTPPDLPARPLTPEFSSLSRATTPDVPLRGFEKSA